MDPVNVTVISCLYGQSHDRFLHEWLSAIRHLNPQPRRVVLATDRNLFMPEVWVVTHMNHSWAYPQAFYLNAALEHVETDWVCIADIDDELFPDALEGVEDCAGDVFQFGYLRSDGEIHLPSPLGLIQMNQLVAGSCVRTDAIRRVGGFRDVEHQDTDLWERLSGSWFDFSDRPRFYYRRHSDARTTREKAAA